MINLVELRLVNRGNIKALATIEFYGLLIEEIKVIQEEGKKPYLRFPEIVFCDDEGRRFYKHILKPSDEVKNQLNRLILRRYLEKISSKRAI